MPIVQVYIIRSESQEPDPGWARLIADSAGEIFGSAPGRTWVKIITIPGFHYAENSIPAEETPEPVFVKVFKKGNDTPAARSAEARSLARLIARVLDRPRERVHIIYRPVSDHTIALGGEF